MDRNTADCRDCREKQKQSSVAPLQCAASVSATLQSEHDSFRTESGPESLPCNMEKKIQFSFWVIERHFSTWATPLLKLFKLRCSRLQWLPRKKAVERDTTAVHCFHLCNASVGALELRTEFGLESFLWYGDRDTIIFLSDRGTFLCLGNPSLKTLYTGLSLSGLQ